MSDRFSTKPLDPETGLYAYTFRYYSPALGRFLNRDPIGEKGGKNLFAFCANSPVSLFDPLGLFIDEPGILSGRYVFTCNCGWIDLDHVDDYYQRYIKIYKAMKDKKGHVVVSFKLRIPGGWTKETLPFDYWLEGDNLDYYTEAMKALHEVAVMEERAQENAVLGTGNLINWTSFAYEDIASSMFGGLVGKLMLRDGLTYKQALEQAMNKCIAMDEDIALSVFKMNKKILMNGTNQGAAQGKMKGFQCACPEYSEWNNILDIAK